MSTKMMSSAEKISNDTSSPGLRQLEPSKAPAFWDSINFRIGTSSLYLPENYDKGSLYPGDFEINFDPPKGASRHVFDVDPVFNPSFGSLSFDDSHQDGMQTTSMTMVAVAPQFPATTFIGGNEKTSDGKSAYKRSVVPHSLPRPDPSCFVQYYAPLEPLILLPNHFSTTPESLEKLSVSIEDYLRSRKDVAFSSSGSSWSGSILRTSCHCAFRFCVYRSRKVENLYIIEGQRVEGDGFLFGDLYQGVKALLSHKAQSRNSSVSSVHTEGENMDMEEQQEREKQEETGAEKSRNSGMTVQDLRNFAQNVKEMVNSEDSQVVLNGIQFAGEMCTDVNMVGFMYELDLVEDLFKVVKQRNVGFLFENKWHCQHALIALSHLAKKYTRAFKKYIDEKMVGQYNLTSLLLVELDGIRQETDGFDGNTAAKIHMIKYSESIREKITT